MNKKEKVGVTVAMSLGCLYVFPRDASSYSEKV